MEKVLPPRLGRLRFRSSARRAAAIRALTLVLFATVAGAASSGAPAPAPSVQSPANTLQVLHWWTSASERKAADLLAARMADEGLAWKDAAIPGGAGIGAGKVLKGRVLAGDAPQVTQIIGASVAEWAELGLLLDIDGVASAGDWNGFLFPTVQKLIQHRGHVVAAPVGIHRVNTLYYNRCLLYTSPSPRDRTRSRMPSSA